MLTLCVAMSSLSIFESSSASRAWLANLFARSSALLDVSSTTKTEKLNCTPSGTTLTEPVASTVTPVSNGWVTSQVLFSPTLKPQLAINTDDANNTNKFLIFIMINFTFLPSAWRRVRSCHRAQLQQHEHYSHHLHHKNRQG